MRSPRFVELAVLIGLVALAVSYFARRDQQAAVRNLGPRGEFRWSETRAEYTYYFQLRSGGSWIAVLCSNSGPMPGNFVSTGKLNTEDIDIFLSSLETNGICALPDRGGDLPILMKFERDEVSRVRVSDDDLPARLAEILDTGLLGRERERLRARKARGEVPDFGFAVLPSDWPHSSRNNRSLYWEESYIESTPKYAELAEKENLILFFQNITTNGGHRTDLSVFRSEDGGLYYEASTPELKPPLEVHGEVSPGDYEAFQAALENLGDLRFETSFGHDCTYYALYQRAAEHSHSYYQWYGCGPMSFEYEPMWRMLEEVFRSKLYRQALNELKKAEKNLQQD